VKVFFQRQAEVSHEPGVAAGFDADIGPLVKTLHADEQQPEERPDGSFEIFILLSKLALHLVEEGLHLSRFGADWKNWADLVRIPEAVDRRASRLQFL
jgi:hypothetical protein